jgi:hypothetical protein
MKRIKVLILSVIVVSFLTSNLLLTANPKEQSSPLKTVLTTGSQPMKKMSGY